jgi:hypothetical protein
MAPNHEPKYPSRRSYVLKVNRDAKPGALAGRLENLVTGRHCEFASSHELPDSIASDLEEGSPAVVDGTDKCSTKVPRSVLFRGAGLEAAWPQFAALALIGTVMFVISLVRFRRTLGSMASANVCRSDCSGRRAMSLSCRCPGAASNRHGLRGHWKIWGLKQAV